MQTLLFFWLPLTPQRRTSSIPRRGNNKIRGLQQLDYKPCCSFLGAFDTTATSLEQPEAREHCKLRGFQQPECKPCCSFLGAFDTTATSLEQPEALEHYKIQGFQQPECKPFTPQRRASNSQRRWTTVKYKGFSSPNANLVVPFFEPSKRLEQPRAARGAGTL